MLRDLASFLFFLSLLPFLFHGVQETSPDLRIWLLANLEEFFKFIISLCHSSPSSTFVVSFRFMLLIFYVFLSCKTSILWSLSFWRIFFCAFWFKLRWQPSGTLKTPAIFHRRGEGGGYEDFVVSRQNLPDPPEGSLIFLGSPPSLVVNFTKIPLFFCNILLAATDLSFRSLRKIRDPTLSSEPLSSDENDD